MSSSKELLQNIALETNAHLDIVVGVENDLGRISWRRIIPIPFLFNPIDFSKHAEELHYVLQQLELHSDSLKKISQNNSEKALWEFSNLLAEYREVLADTVGILFAIAYKLKRKADGENYPWIKYKNNMSQYQKARKISLRLGLSLNEVYSNTMSH